ncbi:MAG: anaerobic ribonucleoside-triphosphate reductase activating protein [Desulfovibrio sp.]|nr:anaerobic ribonucleoside-triphosphate reductase activating protein [Desulfovibrio sp.]
MRIGALQKTTMLDFPGRVSAIVFAQGCNFVCPYCHNPDLKRQGDLLEPDGVLEFLTRRRRLLEGVVITGGEPTLQEGLAEFCRELKELGYAIKLDTNGSRPDVLERLLRENLLDYVAMDVKADPRRYPREISAADAGDAVSASVDILNGSPVPREFRVPCAEPFINRESFQAILEMIPGDIPIFLQKIRLERVLDPDFFAGRGRALNRAEMELLRAQADSRGKTCLIR